MKAPKRMSRIGITLLLSLLVLLFISQPFAQADTWATKAPMPEPLEGGGGAALNGLFYVASGASWIYGTNFVFAYDPVTDTWATKAPMPPPRTASAPVVALDGKLFVPGGAFNSDWNVPRNDLHVYDPGTDTWTTKAPMPTARSGTAAAAIDGKLYVVGGLQCYFCTPIATLEVYDPATDTWSTKAPMPTPRRHLVAAAIGGKLYAVGGFRGAITYGPCGGIGCPLDTVEVYDPASNTWETKTPMPSPRGEAAAGVINGKLHVFGGVSTIWVTAHEVYDPGSDTWTTKAPLPTVRRYLAGGAIGDQLFAAGGRDVNSSLLDVLEVYTAVALVAIDIKPGSEPNSWPCKKINDELPVAILSDATFDATAVDADSVRFGRTGTEAAEVHTENGTAKRHVEDVDKDGFPDMVFHFRFGNTGFSCEDIPGGGKSVTLTGKLSGIADGTPIQGEGSLRLVKE